MPPRSLIAGYFALQAVAGALWWMMLWLWPASREWFWPTRTSDSVLLAFAAADVVCFVGGSALAAVAVAKRLPGARAVLWLVVGAVSYATLYVLATFISTGECILAVVLMCAAAVLTWLAALGYRE